MEATKQLPGDLFAKAVQAMSIALQINEKGKYQAFVGFAGHVWELYASVEPVGTDYAAKDRVPAEQFSVYLNWPCASKEIDALIAHLQRHLEV